LESLPVIADGMRVEIPALVDVLRAGTSSSRALQLLGSAVTSENADHLAAKCDSFIEIIRCHSSLGRRVPAQPPRGSRAGETAMMCRGSAAGSATAAAGRPGPPGPSWLRAGWRWRRRDAVTERAAAPVIAKYTGVLGGADIEVYTRTTTFAIMQSLRLDRGPSGPVHP
jgi:hypothetical protein